MYDSETRKDRTAAEESPARYVLEWVDESAWCRPPEPTGTDHVRYRGWEVGYDPDAANWCGQGWRAYKGGCDLGAPEVMADTYAACVAEIDEQEDEA